MISTLEKGLIKLVKIVKYKECSVYILGTNHISLNSQKEVSHLIQQVKPNIVFVEWSEGDLFAENNESMEEGGEFRVAVNEGKKIGAKIILGDRSVNVTDKRLWLGLPILEFFGINLGGLNNITVDVNDWSCGEQLVKAVKELGEKYPWYQESMLFERDEFMACKLKEAVDDYKSNPGQRRRKNRELKLVAAMGLAHVDGVIQHLLKEDATDYKVRIVELNQYPKTFRELLKHRWYVWGRLHQNTLWQELKKLRK